MWHIHGEIRRKSSIILNHDEYMRLVTRVIEWNKENRNRYEIAYTNLRFKSWIDYFIMGDLYILGSGLDFSEHDLWWLLMRRERENASIGKLVFYNPKEIGREENDVERTIKSLSNAEVANLNEFSKAIDYPSFYEKAVCDIHKRISAKRKRE